MEKVHDRDKRIKKLAASALALGAAGAAYAVFCSLTHIYIPCVFRLVTGLKCPGCGITHCLLALLHGDFREAYTQNQFVFCILPFAAVYAGYRAWRYIWYGRRDYSRLEEGCFIVLIAAAILFGIWRNLV